MSLRQNSDAPLLDTPSLPKAPSASHTSPDVSSLTEINSFVSRSEQPAETAVARSRRALPRAAYAVVPSVLFLSLGLATRNNTLTSPTSSTRSESALQMSGGKAILAASQTMIVPATTASSAASPVAPLTLSSSASTPSVIWRARLQPVVDVVGRAPISGQITRVWAQTGQSVSVGDRVLRILSYSDNVVADAPRRNYDSAAEEEQVQAVRAQSDLGTRLSQAQARLKAAQIRVARAQKRVDEAMSVVRKLQSGAATESDIEYSEETPKSNSAINAAEVQAAQATAERASQAAENARDEAASAEREASRAESEAQDKARRARELHQTRDAAKAALSKATKTTEPASDATANDAALVVKSPVAKPEALSVSAAAVAEADSAARESASRAAGLRGKANAAKAVADKAESRAQTAITRAKAALRSLQLFDDDAPAPRRKSSTRSSAKLPSVSQAARMVREATDESRAASREAERWKTEVDEYSRQARQTQQQLAESEQNLGSSQHQAQQQELETTLQRNLSIVRAPANGTIVQIGDVGDSVSSGDAILMVGKAGVLRAQFSDTSGLWRKLKPGATLSATVSMRDNKVSNRATSSTRSLPDVASQTANAIPVMARVEEVEKPLEKGAPALVKTTVQTVVNAAMRPTDFANAPGKSVAVKSPGKPTRLRAGMTILCTVDAASLALNKTANVAIDSAADGVSIPQQAVVMLQDATRSGDIGDVSADSPNGAHSNDAPNTARAHVAVLRPHESGNFVIEWREVQAQPAATSEQRLVRGLFAGERVALDAVALRDLILNFGNETQITLRDNVQEELK